MAATNNHSMLETHPGNPRRRSSVSFDGTFERDEMPILDDLLDADWDAQIPKENMMFIEEELESFAPVEGDALAFYRAHKVRVADRSGSQLPEPPKKEKAVPLKPPNIL